MAKMDQPQPNQSDSEFEREFEKTTRDLAALIVRASGVELAKDIRLEAERNWTSILTTRLTQLCELQAERLAHISEEGTACGACHDAAHAFELPRLRLENEDLRERLKQAEEQIEAGHELLGSFFEALKPLNLTAINTGNPGVHVTALIHQIDLLNQEIETAITDDCDYCKQGQGEVRRIGPGQNGSGRWVHKGVGYCAGSEKRERRYQREQQGGKG